MYSVHNIKPCTCSFCISLQLSCFQEIFSEELIMSSVQFPRLIIPATIADCRPAKLHAFKNFGYREENGCPSPQSTEAKKYSQ